MWPPDTAYPAAGQGSRARSSSAPLSLMTSSGRPRKSYSDRWPDSELSTTSASMPAEIVNLDQNPEATPSARHRSRRGPSAGCALVGSSRRAPAERPLAAGAPPDGHASAFPLRSAFGKGVSRPCATAGMTGSGSCPSPGLYRGVRIAEFQRRTVCPGKVASSWSGGPGILLALTGMRSHCFSLPSRVVMEGRTGRFEAVHPLLFSTRSKVKVHDEATVHTKPSPSR